MLDIHLDAFQKRLPFFHRYDHTNYTRGADDMWCCVICANEKASSRGTNRVNKGNWVVKGSSRENFIRYI